MGARSTEAETVSTPMKSRPYATYTFIIFYAILTWLVYRSYVQDQMHSGSWGCEMSWMTPSYIRLAWPEAPSKKYSIYLYREQGWDTEERVSSLSGNPFLIRLQLKGHPVIFIPGNAGSYQQVRSIASSASRQFHEHPGGRADDMQDAKSLDFFASMSYTC
jgi:glycosylphosphatidylinositol deacylase